MKLGVFAKTFASDSIGANLDAVQAHGFGCTQYNLVCAGLPTLPDEIDLETCQRIRDAHRDRNLTMAAISGTFNIIDPDRERLRANMRRLRVLVQAAPQMGTGVITLCAGTRDAENMWRSHPENDSPEAWREMTASIRRIVTIVEGSDITVAVEPEVNNVVDTAAKARQLLDEVGSSHLKVVFDAANLFHHGQLSAMHEILDEAIDAVGPDIVIAHAKDLSHDGDAGHEAAGTGLLDYDYYLKLLAKVGFDGPLIAHGLSEDQAGQCARFLQGKMKTLQHSTDGPSADRKGSA